MRPMSWFVLFHVVMYTAMHIDNRQIDGIITDNQTGT
jgi:hypothetical protein